jgi:MFS family permease
MATLVQQAEQPLARKSSALSALKNTNFRLYFVGQMVSISGTWMQNIAQSYLVFEITKSELWLGIVACLGGLPLLILSPLGGVVVERVPRRTLLIVTQTIQMILAFILAALAFAHAVQVWHIVVLAILLGITNVFDTPARQTFVVEIVGKDDLRSGIALNSIMNSMGRVLGPTAAGIALIQLGDAWCFMLNGLSFLAVLGSLFMMKVPYAIKYIGGSSPIRQMREGLSYARRDPLIMPLLILAGIAGFFILPLLRLFPAVADVLLHSPEQAYAAISVAEGTGSVIGGIIVGWLSHRFGQGKVIAAAIVINALANALLALQGNIPPAVIITLFFGSSMILLFVSLNTAIQMTVPDSYRGRVMSLYSLAMLGTTPFGSLAIGALADAVGIGTALIINGFCIVALGGAVIARWPNILRYNARNRKETSAVPTGVVEAVGD